MQLAMQCSVWKIVIYRSGKNNIIHSTDSLRGCTDILDCTPLNLVCPEDTCMDKFSAEYNTSQYQYCVANLQQKVLYVHCF